MIEIEKALRQAVDLFRLSSSLKNRHRPGWRFLLFTTKPSVIVFRPTWKVNVKRVVLTSSRKWGQPPAVVCSACCRCSLKSTSHFVTQCNKLLQPHHKRSRTINFVFFSIFIVKKAPPDEKSGGAFFAYQVINVRAFPQHVTPCFPLFHAQTSFSTPSRTAFQSTA